MMGCILLLICPFFLTKGTTGDIVLHHSDVTKHTTARMELGVRTENSCAEFERTLESSLLSRDGFLPYTSTDGEAVLDRFSSVWHQGLLPSKYHCSSSEDPAAPPAWLIGIE